MRKKNKEFTESYNCFNCQTDKIKFRAAATTTTTTIFFRWHICKRWCRHVVSPLVWILKWCESTENRCVRTTTTDKIENNSQNEKATKLWMVKNDNIAMNDHWWKQHTKSQHPPPQPNLYRELWINFNNDLEFYSNDNDKLHEEEFIQFAQSFFGNFTSF